MKFGVVVFPGSNCDEDMVYVLKNIMGQETVKLWHKNTDLEGCDFIVLPGGFSYGDYLRSGAIARFSPIMESVIAHANKGGYLFGVCNGFQILCEGIARVGRPPWACHEIEGGRERRFIRGVRRCFAHLRRP